MKATYAVSPEVVEWVISQVGEHTEPLKSLNQWKTGEKIPTFNEIQDISKKTRIPLGYFFLKTPPKEEIKLLEYRTIASEEFDNPSRDLIDTIADMEEIVDWTRDYLIAEGSEINPIVGKLKHETNVMVMAEYIREVLGLSIDWFKTTANSFNYLRDTISEAGVLVMMNGVVRNNTHRPLDINEFRAFTLIDEFAPLIFINAADSASGRLFSLLHEFVHICLGVDNLFNDNRYSTFNGVKKQETLCNAVAAEILVPASLFGSIWDAHSDQSGSIDEIVENVARYFTCGRIVIARRALDTGRIEQPAYDEIVRIARADFHKQKQTKKTGGDFYRTKESRIDKRFLAFLVDSVSRGKTLYSEAFKLTDTNRHTFPKLVERMEF